jgi:hypothetical protein
VLRKSHPFGGKLVDTRSLQQLLPVATDISDSQVVCQDVNDIGFFRSRARKGKGTDGECSEKSD